MSVAAYAFAFVLTWLVESAVLVIVARAGIGKILLVSFAVNLLTNTLANWTQQHTELGFAAIEGLVCAAEAPLFALLLGLRVARAAFVSLVVNGVTASASLLL